MPNRIRNRLVFACSVTGDVACMDCIEGQCGGSEHPVRTVVHECDCGGHDAFGEMYHEESCNHFRPVISNA